MLRFVSIAAVLVSMVFSACGSDAASRREAAPVEERSTASGVGATAPPPYPYGPEVADVIFVGQATGLTFAGGDLWVANEDEVSRIDPATAEVTETIATESYPGALTAGDGMVWLADWGSGPVSVRLLRIDPATNEVVATVEHPDLPDLCCDIAIAADSVWASDTTKLLRVDIGSNTVTEAIEIPGRGFLNGVVAGERYVWVARQKLLGVDPGTGEVSVRVDVGEVPGPWMADGGLVWGQNGNREVWAVRESTGQVVRRLELDAAPRGVAADGDDVWVTTAIGTLLRLDGRTGRVLDEIKIGPSPARIFLTPDSVWITDFDQGVVQRIEREAP